MFARTFRRSLGCCLAVALAAAGCTSGDGSTGSLELDLELVDGSSIDRVDWEITGGDMDPMSGVIDTSAPGSTASVEVFGIPAGEEYLITLSAESEDGTVTCEGSA